MQTRPWRKDGEDSDRFSTEILLAPGSRVQFLDRAKGNAASADAGKPANGSAQPTGTALAQSNGTEDGEIPF